MKRLIIAALIMAPFAARAQTAIIPPAINGCGTMAVTTTSAAITPGSVTLCPNSTPLPAAGAIVPLGISVQGNSTSAVIFCPFGGTCATVGRYLAVGEGTTKNIRINSATNPPTVVTPSGTATIYLEWYAQ